MTCCQLVFKNRIVLLYFTCVLVAIGGNAYHITAAYAERGPGMDAQAIDSEMNKAEKPTDDKIKISATIVYPKDDNKHDKAKKRHFTKSVSHFKSTTGETAKEFSSYKKIQDSSENNMRWTRDDIIQPVLVSNQYDTTNEKQVFEEDPASTNVDEDGAQNTTDADEEADDKANDRLDDPFITNTNIKLKDQDSFDAKEAHTVSDHMKKKLKKTNALLHQKEVLDDIWKSTSEAINNKIKESALTMKPPDKNDKVDFGNNDKRPLPREYDKQRGPDEDDMRLADMQHEFVEEIKEILC